MFENDVKDKQGKYEGVYTFQGFSNERDYWVDAAEENAIWYISGYQEWAIGIADKFGTMNFFMLELHICEIQKKKNLFNIYVNYKNNYIKERRCKVSIILPLYVNGELSILCHFPLVSASSIYNCVGVQECSLQK